MTDQELMKLALEAREAAYAPHSGYAVGAALLSADGRAFLGCNVENSSYSATCCAERTAFCKAVSEGVTSFSAIAVAGGKKGSAPDTFFMPCGICRPAAFAAKSCGSFVRMILSSWLPTARSFVAGRWQSFCRTDFVCKRKKIIERSLP